ncbi:uncharacterized protein K460DRAFT_350004 [Cucurbitaria berberidis CBS 394.84]|uniref:GPI anchored protein n=1 Tax=Cucurbitaria berberidis CBS 394.84 TaxID=1168544 RepID=A0A9P4GRA5_9PLEO|nr:uncharacterized protein K460DRAFT_350004 [Cucurbitaria berberidis CBS 394.84]KAF1849864.1 hypothetical protein K460DRAFT_350004 [Cucurbitaria berberidis CBS 394.84]
MHIPSLLSLPSAFILLVCATSSSADAPWPHNLPGHVKYFPEDEVLAKRGLSIKEKLQKERPIGVKKMSVDEGEMFMLDNWIFASDLDKRSDSEDLGNGTSQARSPLRPLADEDFFSHIHIRNVLLKRQFKCPQGTNSCSSIGAPDVCCGTGSTCINVNGNTDAGSVGCCPQGQTCAGAISCDTTKGYSSCPNSSNGGCCLPGFRCQGIGCVFEGTSITYVQPPTSSPPSPPSSTAVVVVPTTPSTTSTETSRSAYTCSTGWFSCPANVGGGCCQNGRTCATGASCLGDGLTSTQAPSAPVRPTSGSVSSESVSTTAESTDDTCPTGFYVCSAYYPSGCCRVGRDCQTTGSCALPTETILSSNGVVIVAPTGAGVATTAAPQSGSCPNSWYSCPANRGGNCCPNGYECGEQCTATGSGQSGVSQKVAPSTASFVSGISVYIMAFAAFSAGVAMVVL